MAPSNTNSVLLVSGSDCVIFDAWGFVDDWQELLSDRGLNLHAIYSTHGHGDHVSAAPELAGRLGIDWYLSHHDFDLFNATTADGLSAGNALLKYFEMPEIPDNCKQPIDLHAGEIEVVPGQIATIIETPGHSSGGISFYFPAEKVLIIGDTIFQDCIGRYDLPGADLGDLRKSISKIYNMNLPDDTMVIHGHGIDTTIGWLRKNNPYFK